MAITFVDIAPKTVVRTANDVAPLDSRIDDKPSRKIPEASRKISEPSRNIDGNYRDAVVVVKRGRPPTGSAMSDAERARRYRERRKDRAAASVSHASAVS